MNIVRVSKRVAAILISFSVGMLAIQPDAQSGSVCGLGVCIDLPPRGSGGGGGGGGGGEGGSSNLESQEPDRKHSRWAKEYEQEGNLNAAAEEYRKAIAYDPNWPGYRNSLGNVLLKQEKYAEALEAYMRYSSLKPNNPIAHHNIGLALWNLGRYKEAEAELTTAIRLDPTFTSAQQNLLALVGNIKNVILYNGFQRAYNEEDPQKAEALYRQYLLLDPTNSAALGNLGRQLQRQGRFIAAEAAYREAIRYGASNPESREWATNSLNNLVASGVNKDAFKQLLAANEQGVAASQEKLIEAIKGRSITCFGDTRGCVYSNDHAFEKVVLTPRKSLSANAPIPAALQSDKDFAKLQQSKEEQKKEYKETYDALQAAWALKDSGKVDKGIVDLLIVEQKNKLSTKASEIRTTELKIEDKYKDLGFIPPKD